MKAELKHPIKMKRSKVGEKNNNRFFAIIILYFILALLTSLFIGSVFYCIANLLILVAIIAVDKNYFKEKFLYSFRNIRSTLKCGLIGLIITLPWLYMLSFFSSLPGIGYSMNFEIYAEVFSSPIRLINILNIIISFSIIVPIIEECVFRVGLLGVLEGDQPTKKIWPYLIAILAFSLAHVIPVNYASFLQFLPYLYISTIIVLTYKFSKHNLLSVIIVHSLNNFCFFFIYPLFIDLPTYL